VHPLALGNVKRSVEQIWQLAKKLVRLHTPDADEAALSALVTRLTTELYSHSHLITRAEATALGLPSSSLRTTRRTGCSPTTTN